MSIVIMGTAKGDDSMTFQEFQATKQVRKLCEILPECDFEKSATGLIYCDKLYIEDASSWHKDGYWHSIICQEEFLTTDFESIEQELYAFALSEGYCKD